MQTRTPEKTTVHHPASVRRKRPIEHTEVSRTINDGNGASTEEGHKEIQIQVEFKLTANGAKSVAVAGNFNNWDAKTPLGKDGECWVTTIKLPRGRYEYRFIVDGKWMSDPSAKEIAQNPFGSSNSVLIV